MNLCFWPLPVYSVLLEGSYFSPCRTRTSRSNYISPCPVFLWCVYELREVDQYILMHCSSPVSMQDTCKYPGPEAPMYLTLHRHIISIPWYDLIHWCTLWHINYPLSMVMECSIFKGILYFFILWIWIMSAGFKYSWVVMSPAIIALTTSPIVTELPSHLWSPTGCPPLSPGG